jgi:fibronectin type 3 domain-containing protein
MATCTIVVKLATPITLKKVSGGHDYVKLSWGTVSGASGYQIYRATSKTGSYTMIKATTASSFTNNGLTTGSTFYYKVRAYRYQDSKKLYSSFTTVISTIPIPSTPSNVKLVKPKAGMITLTWDKVTGASGYEVYRTSSKSEPYKLIRSNTSLHFINYGLTKGKTYYYKVRAYKLVGKKKVYSTFSVSLSMKM